MDGASNGLDTVTRGAHVEELSALRDSAAVVMSTHDADFARAAGAEIVPFSSLQSHDRYDAAERVAKLQWSET